MFRPYRRNDHDRNHDLSYSLKVYRSGSKGDCHVLLDVHGHRTSRNAPRLGNNTDGQRQLPCELSHKVLS